MSTSPYREPLPSLLLDLELDSDELEAFLKLLPWLTTGDTAARCARSWAWTVWLGEALETCARAMRVRTRRAISTLVSDERCA